MKFFVSLLFILIFPLSIHAQNYAFVSGRIIDSQSLLPIKYAPIKLATSVIATSDSNGMFSFKVEADKNLLLSIEYSGYKQYNKVINYEANSNTILNILLEFNSRQIDEVNVTDVQAQTLGLVTINPKEIQMLPDVSGNGIESILKTVAGVYTHNELSSQYSVRGGNFDENLVYINEVEVFRPFLVRSGQQEGLSAINPDLVSSVNFSAGGFDAKYGDKMSSVLDIRYKKPDKFAASANMSLLGASAHIEGAGKNKRFTHISGIRYKTSEYLLKTLETSGEYKPRFFDFQTFLTFAASKKLEFSLLGNLARNSYEFIPTDRSSDFGTLQDAINIYVDFEGKEVDKFSTITSAFTSTFRPNSSLSLKLIASTYYSNENENFDIDASYMINQLDVTQGTEKHDSMLNLGIGRYLHHARNELISKVNSIAHHGSYSGRKISVEWGLNFEYNNFEDKLNEWKVLDSAGYFLPHPFKIPYNDTVINISNTIFAKNQLNTYKISTFLQTFSRFSLGAALGAMNLGIRTNYSEITGEFLVSPRAIFSLKPQWQHDIMFRLSGGMYHQPPFYRELRNLDGSLNTKPKAQRSYQILFGSDFYFKMWNRPFKFTSELYYKYLTNLIPYEIDNVRIRYFANERATGYATGIDLKLNGEFVPGVESWASFSFMQTREEIENDTHGLLPRPTDQIANIGIFFQDYLPGNKTFKFNMSFLFGSRLPFGPSNSAAYADTLRMPGYKRVDIGFSKIIKSEYHQISNKKSIWRHFKSVWLSFEVYNLLGIPNVISYDWLNVVPNSANAGTHTYAQYAVPNRLTNRRYNLKIVMKF